MANSTTNLDTISSSQASKEITANALFDAGSMALTYGRRASTTGALTWGYYGGNITLAAGTLTQIANGTVSLTASQTNYLVAAKSSGAVSVSTATTNWNDTANYWRLYSIVAGASSVTSYTDARQLGLITGSTFTGAMTYQGTWNASSNTPTLASGTGTKGYYYTVSTSGTTTLDGVSLWTAGDIIAFNGTTWEKIDANLSAQELGNLINAATEKTTPADADMVGLMDSAASNILKKLSWANIKATLKTWIEATTFTTLDINGGTIDGAVIGGATPAAGSFTTLGATDGSVSQPSITNIGDVNTGLYFPAEDEVAIGTGGTHRVRVGSTGDVSIGPSSSLTGFRMALWGNTSGVSASQNIMCYAGPTYLSSLDTYTTACFSTYPSTEAATFTLPSMFHFRASQGTLGAGSTVTDQVGFEVTASLIGATTNYGFRTLNAAAVTSGKTHYSFFAGNNIATGGGTTWNFFAGGTAPNHFSGDVKIYGAGGLGYATGSGGTVAQATSRTTGVTLNKTNGAITLVSAAGSTSWQSFTVTNSTVAATDTVIVSQKAGTDLNMIFVTAVAAGSFRISFATTGGTTTEQPVFNFAVIKAVTS